MASTLIDSIYYRDFFGTQEIREIFSDNGRFQSWIDAELALAKAQATLEIIPKQAVLDMEKSFKIENLNIPQMKEHFEQNGFPILPFVKQLTNSCDEETAKWVHYGATTQDILDTGTVLQIKKAFHIISNELDAIIKALCSLTKKHKQTPMAGRTFQQIAAPITLGFKTAVWLDEVLRHKERFLELKNRVLVGQCSGAVGTFATMGDMGLEVQRLMMEELGLKIPAISWHTARDYWTEIVSFFAMLSATFAKIANEVTILMRSEIGELSEPFETGRGASSTMPHKRNPISSEPILAIAPKMRELLSSQLVAMIQEHERGVGQMNIEWMVMPEAFIYICASLKHTRFILENLIVDKEKMEKNLNLYGGLIMAEAVMMGLAPKVGKSEAHHLVMEATNDVYAKDINFKNALLNSNAIMTILTENEIDNLLNPLNYIGDAYKMIEAVLKKVDFNE